jgi:hypothetical protein
MSYKTQKLAENNKAKGLTNVNQGVQIYNIWHLSSYTISNHKEKHIWVWFMLALLSYNEVKCNVITKYKNVVWRSNKVYYNGEIMKTVAH